MAAVIYLDVDDEITSAAARIRSGENGLAGIESLLAVLRGAGFGEAEAVRACQALLCYTIGFVTIEAPLGAAGLDYEALPASRFPNTVALADRLSRLGAPDEFEPGLDLLLRGLAAERPAEQAPARPDPVA